MSASADIEKRLLAHMAARTTTGLLPDTMKQFEEDLARATPAQLEIAFQLQEAAHHIKTTISPVYLRQAITLTENVYKAELLITSLQGAIK